MVWDASAGAVRASYWRTTVDEDGHYCFAAASDSPHRTLMRRNNADARKGLMRLPAQALVPRVCARGRSTLSASQPSSRGLAALAPSLPPAPAERDNR